MDVARADIKGKLRSPVSRADPAPGPRDLPADGGVVVRAEELSTAPQSELPSAARGAVIIPAHNESAVIARTLRSLTPLVALEGMEIIVACNGCTDDTAEIARRFDGVLVVETELASKAAGLNLGDELATGWPRLYLDADVEIAPSSVLTLFDALAEPGVLAGRPYYVYDAIGATAPVRAYYRARSRVRAPQSRLWGAGAYAATREGHERFDRFPSVTADDSWFDEQFAEAEKHVVATTPMRVRTPRNVVGLIAMLTRHRRGYLELGISSQAGSRSRALLLAVRTPRDVTDTVCYVLLTAVSRCRAAGMLRRSERVWERDRSSRSVDAPDSNTEVASRQ